MPAGAGAGPVFPLMVYSLLRPLLFCLDGETAHDLTLGAFDALRRLGLAGAPPIPASFPRTAMGLEFPNPVGLAAGLDKNGEYIDALARLGFGFIEVGTVTPRPQAGNPRPRLFRIPAARALINRMGFNNDGVDRLLENVQRARYRGILGINIGKNFDTPRARAVDDYIVCLRKVYAHASYVAVNISSPNTENLRQLQQGENLEPLLAALKTEHGALAKRDARHVPLVVKIAPDLDAAEIGVLARRLLKFGIDGVIATNTTLARDGVQGLPHAHEAGGLSGAPLKSRSTDVIHELSAVMQGRIAIIGAGGIMSAQDAREKFAAGASLIQVYSGLIFEGPGLVGKLCAGLQARESPEAHA